MFRPATAFAFALLFTLSVHAGETNVLKWKDGREAVFMLAFDDSAPSQLKNVVPELDRRKIPGTFYLVTGHKLWAALRTKWEEAVKSPYIVAANHTFTHTGATTPEVLEGELSKCNEVLYALHPELPVPRLLGFGHPGGVPWTVTKEQLQAALEKNHLVERPPFAGSPMNYKSAADLIGVVDKALASGGMGHLDFHGVGGDWLVTPMEWFTALLDKLEAERERLWITDTASWYKYAHERDTAQIKTVEDAPGRIRLTVTASLDPALYNEPLTLSTKVPAGWKTCQVSQGAAKLTAPVREGAVQYNALPGGGEILLTGLDGK